MDKSIDGTVRLTEPGQLAAALPYLVGFPPSESVVLVALGGESAERVGMTARADLPARAASHAVTRELARRIGTGRPVGAVVMVVSEAPDVGQVLPGQPSDPGVPSLPHRDVVHDQVRALTGLGIAVVDVLLVRAGRWWSYDCPLPCCSPERGAPLPDVAELAAASVAAGVVVERSRKALAARIARPDGEDAAAMEAVARRVGARYAKAALARPGSAEGRAWGTVLRAVARCRTEVARPLPDQEVAQVLWAVADVRVRDRALGLALGDDAAAAEVLWTECTRRAPVPLDAAPATLLAATAWLRGDGAMANVALERALTSRPTYSLAALLAQALASCLPPEDLRALITAAVTDAGLAAP